MYLTLQHLIDRFGADELVAVTNDRISGSITASQLEQYAALGDPSPGFDDDVYKVASIILERMEDAEAFVMSYVHSVYNVNEFTAANVPRDVRYATAAVARYYLHENRMSPRVRQAYEDAVRWLEGNPNVGVNEEGQKTKQAGVTVQTNVEHEGSRLFGGGSEKRFTEGY